MIATMSAVRKLVARDRIWGTIVAVSASMMTIYLWHLTALSLVGAAGIFLFDGALLSFEPGTATWWWLRPAFFLILVLGTVLLVGMFARFETNINQRPGPRNRGVWFLGLLLAIGATATMAFVGIVTRHASVNWYIPLMTVIAGGLIGAYPSRVTNRDP